MKKSFSLLLVGALSLNFFSCKDDDDSGKSLDEKIVGVWKLEKTLYQEIGEADEVEYPDDCEKKSTTTFNKDKTYKNDEYYNDNNSNQCMNDVYGGVYKIENGNLHVLDDETIFKIQEITSNKMVLALEEDTNSDGKIDYKVIATFIK
ncbi:lipocalin family protein [Empedobacter tilapiae]